MAKAEKKIIAPGRADPALAQDGFQCALNPWDLHGGYLLLVVVVIIIIITITTVIINPLGSLARSAKGQMCSLQVRMAGAQAQSPGVSPLCHGGSLTAAGQVNLPLP